MTTCPTITLSKPQDAEKISAGMLSYMRARLRQRIHSMILIEFERSGIKQADLARRLNKSPRVVHRWLSEPGNIRLSTLSDLIFAISGGEPSDQVMRPLEVAPSNRTIPAWLADALDAPVEDEALEPKVLSATSISGAATSGFENADWRPVN